MALTDIKVRTAKPTDKQYKLTDGNGMHLLVHPNGSRYWRLQYRSSELRFARWSEIDFETSMWTIPAEREAIEGVKHSQRGSKMRTPHLVPLSHQALAVLKDV